MLPVTPTSHEREPSVKRAKSTETRVEDKQEVKAKVRLSGKLVRERHEKFDNILKDNLEECSEGFTERCFSITFAYRQQREQENDRTSHTKSISNGNTE